MGKNWQIPLLVLGATIFEILFFTVGALLVNVNDPASPPTASSVANSVNYTISTPISAKSSGPSPTPRVGPIPSTSTDETVARREVEQCLNSWKSHAETRDLSAYMGHYAQTVDYYRKSNASVAFVKADKERAFSRYTNIRINLSNISITTDPSGSKATAVSRQRDVFWQGPSNDAVAEGQRTMACNG
jgi:hypothetical protein